MALTSRTAWREIRSPLTVEDLRDMLVAPSRGVVAFPSRPYDEVYPGIIIGDCATALTLTLLRSLHVTHVLNAAHGRDNATYSGCYVSTRPSYYTGVGLQFLGVPAVDTRECNICVHFEEAVDFIDKALKADGASLAALGRLLATRPACPATVSTVEEAVQPLTSIDQRRSQRWTATETVILDSCRVTAVLNSAQGIGQPYLVDTDAYFYASRRLPVKFMGLHAIDADWYRLEDWFQVAADFIHDSRRSGKVLVHCVQGLSRSATLVIAYLMIKLHMPLSQALQTVRARREIFPNDGFLKQLIRLNDQLMGMRRVNVSWL